MVALLVVAAMYAVKDSIGGTAYQAGTPYDAYMRMFALSRVILVIVAALIARKRVLTASDALLFWGIGGLSLDVFWQYAPPGALFWFSAALAHAAIGFGIAQLIRYAAYEHPSARFRRAATMTAVAIGTTIAMAGFAVVALSFGSIGGHMLDQSTFEAIAPWLQRLRWLGMFAGCVAIEGCAIAVLRAAPQERRPRALLVVAGFAPLALATSAHALAVVVTAHDNALLRNRRCRRQRAHRGRARLWRTDAPARRRRILRERGGGRVARGCGADYPGVLERAFRRAVDRRERRAVTVFCEPRLGGPDRLRA